MLTDWQARLEAHFKNLRQQRPPYHPIFGLEHPLNEDERNALSDELRIHISKERPSWEHRLAWMVYATELGYRYSGDEYWVTFESKTPNWVSLGERPWIRSCFDDFCQTYGAARPAGPWAENFSIICWPITHAILPVDLQRQLAHILYDVRYQFTDENLHKPQILGELIAALSWRESRRFQRLAQEPLFIGQIAAALLLEGEEIASSLILPSTLRRISLDLDRERTSKGWLHQARQNAKKEIQLQTIGKGKTSPLTEDREKPPQKTFSLQPRILLSPYDEDSWEVKIELPDLSQFSAEYPKFQQVLATSLCYVSGYRGRPLPPAYLMYGSQKVPITDWPSDGESILTFEPTIPELEHIFKSECGIRSSSSWLFKIASDGTAYQMSSSQVLAGHRYVLLSKDPHLLSATIEFPNANIKCSGIHGLLVDLPSVISPEILEALKKLGLVLAKKIRIWPSGLVPPRWDGEGYAECLSTEKLTIAIAADHPVGTYGVELDAEKFFMSPSSSGLPLFVEISDLEPGSHLLKITSADDDDDDSTSSSGSLEIHVRKPRIWSPSLTNYGAFMVVVQPTIPSLEELWEGAAKVELFGPISKSVRWNISFYQKGKNIPSLSHEPTQLNLPVYARDWSTQLLRLKETGKNHRQLWNAYNSAYSCKITFDAGELGRYVLPADRAFAPLRWGILRIRDQVFLKLIDDSDLRHPLSVCHYDFKDPDVPHSCDAEPFFSADGSHVTSGLFVARSQASKTAILVPQEIHAFQDFTLNPRFIYRDKNQGALCELVSILSYWASASLSGSRLSSIFKNQIVDSMTRRIIGFIAGNRWLRTERLVLDNPTRLSPEAICKTIFREKEEIELAVKLFEEEDRFACLTPRRRSQFFSELLSLYHSNLIDRISRRRGDYDSYSAWLSEYALRLASSDRNIAEWAGDKMAEANGWLLSCPSLILLARLLVDLIRKAIDMPEIDSSSCPGWQWD